MESGSDEEGNDFSQDLVNNTSLADTQEPPNNNAENNDGDKPAGN